MTQPEGISRHLLAKYAGLATVVVLAAASILYCVGKVISFDTEDTIDFRYIWLAGHIWNAGINPYSDEYRRIGEGLFDQSQYPPPSHWVYPPNWWPIATFLAEYPYEIVRQTWRWITAGVMLAGVTALLPLGRHLGATIRLWRWAAFVIVVAASTATVVSLMMGQTAGICFAGFCCFASAYVRKSAALLAAALVLLALKPTLMLPVCAFLLTDMFWQRSILAAAVVTFTMAFPALYAHGFTATLLGFLNEIARYELLPENFPPAETGVRNLLYHAFGVSVPVLLLVVIAAAIAAALGFLCRTPVLARDRAFHAFTVVALVGALVPFHVYDVVFIAPLVLLCAGWLPPLQGLVLAIVALSQRVGNIQRTLTGFGLSVGGELDFPGSAIFSLAILLVFGIAVTKCLRGASTRETYATIG